MGHLTNFMACSTAVFMTRKGVKPRNNPSWVVYKHAFLAEAIQIVRDRFQTSIRADVLLILDHFLELNREPAVQPVSVGCEPSDVDWAISHHSQEQRARHHADAEKNSDVLIIRRRVAEMEAKLDTLEKEYNALIDQRSAAQRDADDMVKQIAETAMITEYKKASRC